jgi:pimeloyl-ACP methyl ester carboxylesterase
MALALTELPRAAIEGLRATRELRGLIREHRGGDGHPVLVLPGYGGADGSTALLRYFLGQIGYRVFALELGRNVEDSDSRIKSVDDATRFRQQMVEAVLERIRDIHTRTGEKLSLVGWSMGGLYALDAARELPAATRQVVTLGSPFGDPRGTSLFNLMRRLSGSKVPVASQDFQGWLARGVAPAVPTKVIYSPRDGIVGTDIASLPASEHVAYEAIDSSHVAFAINPSALAAVARTLRDSPAATGSLK